MSAPDPPARAPAWLDELQLTPGPPWHAMGTRSLVDSAWLLVDDQRDAELSYKRHLLSAMRDVVSARLPGQAVDAACAELASLVASTNGCALEGDRPPLEAAALACRRISASSCAMTTARGDSMPASCASRRCGVSPSRRHLRRRQTFRRLPESGAIVFTIRTQQVPMVALSQRPDVARGIAESIRSWSDALVHYRGAARWKAPALAWLEGCG